MKPLLKCVLLWLAGLFGAASVEAQPTMLTVSSGTIRFHSDAPQELIRASSSFLKGVLDMQRRTFIFKIGMASFVGFNSPLQQEHFNENYMESSRFPEAIFAGKLIEDIDLTKDGEYTVRAKGKLTVHGVVAERIIRAKVGVKGGKIKLTSDFTVALADHNIKIPRVVYDKLAPDITVSVNATLVPKN